MKFCSEGQLRKYRLFALLQPVERINYGRKLNHTQSVINEGRLFESNQRRWESTLPAIQLKWELIFLEEKKIKYKTAKTFELL